MDLSGKSNEEVIRAFLGGDKSAFETIVDRHEKHVYNLAYRMLGNSADAADLTQDVFLQVLRKLNTFRGESAFSTWLYRVAVNLCKDHLRRKKSTLSLDADPPDYAEPSTETLETNASTVESAVDGLELKIDIQQALSCLAREFRLVVILHDLQGYKYNDIAEMLDISVGTVKSRLSRARHRLAEVLLKGGTIEDINSSK